MESTAQSAVMSPSHPTPARGRALYAVFLELVPLGFPLVGLALVLLGIVLRLPDPILLSLYASGLVCAQAFGVAGLGWMYVGETKIGATILVVRGVAVLALLYYLVRILGEVDCGRVCGDYSVPAGTLLILTVATPVISAIVLAINLAVRRD